MRVNAVPGSSAMRASTSGRCAATGMAPVRVSAQFLRSGASKRPFASPVRAQQNDTQPERATREGPTGLNVGGARPTSPRGWELMVTALKDAEVKLVSSQELLFGMEQGHVVVDIRPESDYDKGHIPGAVNVPFYQPIQGWTPWQTVRRVAFAAFGVLNGTEVNPDFEKDVGELVEGKPFILYCSMGGHLDPIAVGAATVPGQNDDVNSFKQGKKLQTRSMIAAYQLLQAGHRNMSILKGGFSEWYNSGRDVGVVQN